MGFLDDFDGGASYHLIARHQWLPVNRRGGEWESIFQIGTIAGVRSSFYQPLDWGMKWFVEPSLEYFKGSQEIWFEGGAIADYEFVSSDARLAAGRVLGRWGEITNRGIHRRANEGRHASGCPEFPSIDERRGGGEAQFRIDTEDSVLFPTPVQT